MYLKLKSKGYSNKFNLLVFVHRKANNHRNDHF